MSTRFPQERRDYIVKKLKSEGKIRVSELSALFEVSSETIRKDLKYLEKMGIAKKGYGGAVISNERLEPSFNEKTIKSRNEKEKIARATADFIEDGTILLMDAGSTVFTLASMLGLKKELSVFTNAPKTAQILDDYKIKTYLLGGELRSNSNALVGGWAIRALSDIKADIAIIGTSGFEGREGPCVENFAEDEIKKAMIKSANKVIVIGDSNKAHYSSMIKFCNWEDVDVFITDDALPKEVQEEINSKTKLIIV
ncbi:MAG: DeoR/GlpR transcriptional regulator [Clostridiales bacterium]|nr:DeoR/GlpR transcriptional regulator [Clostridiales bacterium]